MMPHGLRTLLAGAIDYAGLFPPAALSLAEAVAEYRRLRDEPLVGRFVCPAAQVNEVPADFPIVAIGRGDDLLAGLRADLAAVAARGGVAALETKVPADLLAYDSRLRDLLAALAEAAVIGRVAIFFEASPDDAELLDRLLMALQETPFASPVGYKLRCGPRTPSASRVALAPALCLHAGVPVKATAGLHQPLPRGEGEHGFINLLVAGVLGQNGAPATAIQEILEEREASAFAFSDAGLVWRDRAASVAQIERARRTAVLSIGSCSIDEPRDGLALGWL